MLFAITCAILGVEHKSFDIYLGFAIAAFFITLMLIYLYRRINRKMHNNDYSSMIILNGNKNKFRIINSRENIICCFFHLERFGENIWTQNLNDIHKVECVLNKNFIGSKMDFRCLLVQSHNESHNELINCRTTKISQ